MAIDFGNWAIRCRPYSGGRAGRPAATDGPVDTWPSAARHRFYGRLSLGPSAGLKLDARHLAFQRWLVTHGRYASDGPTLLPGPRAGRHARWST